MIEGCERCDHGWVRVTAAYVERKAPWPEPPAAELMSEPGMQEQYDAQVAAVTSRRASLAESYYPCKECIPQAFYLWAGGHFAPNHDRAACADCSDRRKRSAHRSSGRRERDLLREGPSPAPAAAPAGARRRDLDGPDDDEKLWRG